MKRNTGKRISAMVAAIAAVLALSGCGVVDHLAAQPAPDTSVVQYEDGSVERMNDGLVSYEQLATDPFGWEDFDVIPKDVWLDSIVDWNEIDDDGRMFICEMLVDFELAGGVTSAQNQFIADAMSYGYSEDRAWTSYAVAVTGCEEISYF